MRITVTTRALFAPSILLALTALIAGPAWADGDPLTDGVPRLLPYTGVLEIDGRPVDASGEDALHLLFALYDGPEVEQPVYTQPLIVEVYGGRFTATIGPVGVGPDGGEVPIDAIISAADDLHLGMTLLGDPDDPADDIPLANRQRIYATPYAMWTTSATNLAVAGQARIGGDLDVGGAARIGGEARVDGALRVGGAVELPAGSLDLDDLTPATVGESLTRNGRSMDVDEAWLDDRIRTWVRSHCRVDIGWRDNCNGCNSAPFKVASGTANGACGNGTRASCRSGWSGFDTDGDVNSDDVFYVRMVCD